MCVLYRGNDRHSSQARVQRLCQQPCGPHARNQEARRVWPTATEAAAPGSCAQAGQLPGCRRPRATWDGDPDRETPPSKRGRPRGGHPSGKEKQVAGDSPTACRMPVTPGRASGKKVGAAGFVSGQLVPQCPSEFREWAGKGPSGDRLRGDCQSTARRQ